MGRNDQNKLRYAWKGWGELQLTNRLTLTGLFRFVDHQPQRDLKGLSHSIPSIAALDSVALTNVN